MSVLTNLEPRAFPAFDAGALLDALPDATAVIGHDGTIVSVNRAWRMFAIDNGGSPESTGVGVNYLAVCARAAAHNCSDAAAVEAGLHAVLQGDAIERELEYPCPSPAVGRWFTLRITQIGGDRAGALVSHVNISRRKMAEENLARKASEDPLTGLANRVHFAERLTSALTVRNGRQCVADVGLVYIDLNDFKPVNDTYGHTAGDEVLALVAGRLRGLVRPQDTVARLGGDEFAMVLPRIDADGLAAIVARIARALEGPHLIHGTDVTIGASVGTYLASRGESASEALQRADEAMYAVKRASRASRRTPSPSPSPSPEQSARLMQR